MAIPRRNQFCPELTPYYLCTTRCVRRAFLCGIDSESGKNFDHRKKWTEDYILVLGNAFCIDVVSYVVMSNHYHVLLHVDLERAEKLSFREVIERWLSIYKGVDLAHKFMNGEELDCVEYELLVKKVDDWRKELSNISRFMGYINERIARRSNKEDEVKGRFWESRFHMQPILDENALLRSMVYVDLNPLRANLANTPEESLYTSLRHRLMKDDDTLMAFRSEQELKLDERIPKLPIGFNDYLELVDWSARQIRSDKSGVMLDAIPGILKRLGGSIENWRLNFKKKHRTSQGALGSLDKIDQYRKIVRQKWVQRELSHAH